MADRCRTNSDLLGLAQGSVSLPAEPAVDRGTRSRKSRIAAATYGAFLLWALFGPLPGEQLRATTEALNSLPWIGQQAEVQERPAIEGAEALVSEGVQAQTRPSGDTILGRDSERVGNVILLVPVGLAAIFATSVPVRALGTAFALPWLVEGLQAVVAVWRSPSWEDVLYNSLGVAMGAAVGLIALCLRFARHRPGMSSGTIR